MLLVFAVCFLGAAVYLVGEVATAPSRERRTGIRRATEYGHRQVRDTGIPRFHERVLAPAMQKLAKMAMRANPRMTMDMINMRLLSAGLNRTITPTTFLAAKAGLAGGGALFGLIFGGSIGGPTIGLMLAMVFGA